MKESKAVLESLQKGSAQPHVYAKDINTLPLLIPDSKCIKRFIAITAPLFTKIQKKEEQSNIAKEARDRLLPKLMNGEIEV